MSSNHDLDIEIIASERDPATVHAIQAPCLLLLLLLNRCNNRCRFCMVDHEIGRESPLPLELGLSLIRKQDPGNRIEFFGGEPTIHPGFRTLVTAARAHGNSCSIATNGRIFRSEHYTRRLAALDASAIYVRTSLYGSNEATHDYYTRRAGSYRQTCRGIENLVRHGFLCQVNIVIMRQNLTQLADIVDQVAGAGVPRVKLGMLVDCAKNAEHLVQLAEVRAPLRAALDRATALGLRVTIEKAPMCVAPEHVGHFACERQLLPVVRAYDTTGACGGCAVARWCPGLEPYYLSQMDKQELIPIRRIPGSQVQQIPGWALDAFQPEMFKIHFIAFDQAWMDDPSALNALVGLDRRIRERLGEMALIPAELTARHPAPARAVAASSRRETPPVKRGTRESTNDGLSPKRR